MKLKKRLRRAAALARMRRTISREDFSTVVEFCRWKPDGKPAGVTETPMEMLEGMLADRLCAEGVMQPGGPREWGDGTILQWIIDNWPAIMEMILKIISIFAAF